MSETSRLPPCVLHEDEHLLVVAKPAGWNTHAPAPHAGEGIYDWLRHREPRWAGLAIVHRLDKDTSGVLVFAKTPLASRSLTAQFAHREIKKRYLLLTDRPVPAEELRVDAPLVRAGERYAVGALKQGATGGEAEGEAALTIFRPATHPTTQSGAMHALLAEPVTGRTHQIRVHAAARGFPVLGDTLYEGTPAPRVCLHATSLTLRHPADGAEVTFEVPADFAADPALSLRAAFIDPALTDAYRLAHGAADGWPGASVERLGEFLLYQAEDEIQPERLRELETLVADRQREGSVARGIYGKRLDRQVRRLAAAEASPRLLAGEEAPARFVVRENGVAFELGFGEGYSFGLFLDQRDNRRRLLVNHVAGGFAAFPERPHTPQTLNKAPERPTLLNLFAYTCGFSVCAALAGAQVTSLDLSRKYLDWGRRNFELNGLDPATHDFIYGDAFDWLRRLARKGRQFDAVLLDPPTFSQSKEHGRFQAERDYGRLVEAALPVLAEGGLLLACSNAARLLPETFEDEVRAAVHSAGRSIEREHYASQPPDFPVSRANPAHLKTLWLRISR